jgi:WD40 repeat protein
MVFLNEHEFVVPRFGDAESYGISVHSCKKKLSTDIELLSVPIVHLVSSNDGGLIGFAGAEGELGVWDAKQSTLVWSRMGNTNAVDQLWFSRDSQLLGVIRGSYVVETYDVKTGKLINGTRSEKGKALAGSFLTDREYGYVTSVGTLVVVDAKTGEVRRRDNLVATKLGSCAAFSVDGTLVAVGDSAGKVSVIAIEQKRKVLERDVGADYEVSHVAIAPDGRHVAVVGHNDALVAKDQLPSRVYVWGLQAARGR